MFRLGSRATRGGARLGEQVAQGGDAVGDGYGCKRAVSPVGRRAVNRDHSGWVRRPVVNPAAWHVCSTNASRPRSGRASNPGGTNAGTSRFAGELSLRRSAGQAHLAETWPASRLVGQRPSLRRLTRMTPQWTGDGDAVRTTRERGRGGAKPKLLDLEYANPCHYLPKHRLTQEDILATPPRPERRKGRPEKIAGDQRATTVGPARGLSGYALWPILRSLRRSSAICSRHADVTWG
jgi:hypothetical protein